MKDFMHKLNAPKACTFRLAFGDTLCYKSITPDDEFTFNKSVPILRGRFWDEVFNFQIFTTFCLRPVIPIPEIHDQSSRNCVRETEQTPTSSSIIAIANYLFTEDNISF